ncbi:MAG: hypothetical protein ABSH32_12935 [Bryobacteraceae bacterium]|jgi:hypothetical protein
MLKFCLSLFLAAASFAQNSPQASENAPAEVDAALRARVSQFFQFQLDGKFHQAEQLVAEDTKDLFVGSNKPVYTSFEIKAIRYDDHFTKAVVSVMVNLMVAAEGFLGRPVPSLVPIRWSRWKLENGQWCWYLDPADPHDSPFANAPLRPPSFGKTAPPPAMPTPAMPTPSMPVPAAGVTIPTAPAPPSRLPVMPNMGAALAVKADKPAVELKTGVPSSEQVTIVNPQPRVFTLSLVSPKTPGLSVKLDRPDLIPGGKVVVSIESSGGPETPRQPVTISVRIQQTSQIIPIKVSFAPSPN